LKSPTLISRSKKIKITEEKKLAKLEKAAAKRIAEAENKVAHEQEIAAE